MTKISKKNTPSYIEAAKKVKIAPIQLLHEIQFLLEENFIGEFAVKNNALDMVFINGQTFRLKICEVVK